MRALTPLTVTLALCLSSLGAACVEDAASGDDTTGKAMDQDKPLLPWAEGNSWTYRVTDGADISTKTTAIGSKVKVGGSGPHANDEAYEVTTLKSDGSDHTVSYQVDIGDKVLRYRELSYRANTDMVNLEEHWDPYKLHIDGTAEHTVADATWLEDYTETKLPTGGTSTTAEQRDRWAVDQVPASVTVPAGTFDNAIKITKAGGDDLKTYWYVRGIGKVKETGGQTEELTEYKVAP